MKGDQSGSVEDVTLVRNVVGFSRRLRDLGLPVVPRTSEDMLRAAHAVGLDHPDDLYAAWRAVSITRWEHIALFDEAFLRFFAGLTPERHAPESPDPQAAGGTMLGPVISADEGDGAEAAQQLGASALEVLGHRDFGEMDEDELEEARRLVANLAWTPAAVLTRRWVPASGGSRPHLRRSLRRMVGPAGELLPIEFADRRLQPRPVVLIGDVSGSMEAYTQMVLTFAHAMRRRWASLEAFVFSTRLTKITRQLQGRDIQQALREVSRAVDDWSGGTKIGDAVERFNTQWSRRLSRRGPVVIIISDGWDRGEPEVLGSAMARLARSVHRIVWLNPLAGRSGYEPATRGLQAAMPFIDDFLPASSIQHLREVVALLESIPDRRAG